ncbi:hypothetical protein ABZ671_04275 [Micromonospora sp. NPDC006766]|uniref:hypothetical protein n=1 Tax=Micromonospora sp. NPDC006766 TaxID=3154778 RepID=UPI0033F81B79
MTRLRSLTHGVLTVLLCTAVVGVPTTGYAGGGGPRTGATSEPPRSPDGKLGVQLLEVSENRRDDPRAMVYIVDHINPGTRIVRRFEVSNSTSTTRRITVFVGAAEVKNNEFVPAEDRDANELPTWVTVDRPSFDARPHSKTTVRATIDIPASAPRGERYGGIWASVSSAGSGGTVQQVHQVGIRLYLDIGPGGDPPSDFQIDELRPGRTDQGLPVIKATVRNTGERALDLTGKAWLSDGPGGLSAGPVPAQVATTVTPGGTAAVMVVLDHQLPNGPWQVRLQLESGRVKREVSGRLTFPQENGAWGLPADLSKGLPLAALLVGSLAILALAAVALVVRRSRAKARQPVG